MSVVLRFSGQPQSAIWAYHVVEDSCGCWLEVRQGQAKSIQEDSTDRTFVFRDYYEALRGLIEAFLLFERVEAERHQCKNAYLCAKHPELELNWSFLETLRLRLAGVLS